MDMVNEATWERIARVILGVVLMIVGFGVMSGTGGTVVGVIGFVPLLTGLSGWCPLYAVFGIHTNRHHRAS
jgi:Protein of unknown function (DUF2892)